MQATSPRMQLGQLPSGLLDALASRSLPSRAIASRLSHGRPTQRRDITVNQLDKSSDHRERVVILGSGWAGYTVARQLNPKKYQAVVVSPRSYFAFTPLLASTSVGTLEFRTALEPVRSRRSNVNYFQGWADVVDFKNKKVTIEESADDPSQGLALSRGNWDEIKSDVKKVALAKKGKTFDLTWDKLIITVGCYSQTFGTPGVKEHALFLKDVGDARKIRNRILLCFETAALPTTTDAMRKNLLNFAIVGGGPTGIEFSAELHDIIKEDLARIYPELMEFYKITVYDVADKVLPMFDEDLGKYAMKTFAREGIKIKTSHHVESLRKGPPGDDNAAKDIQDEYPCWTLRVKEEGDIGVGMVVWSTGLMMNPFAEKALGKIPSTPESGVKYISPGSKMSRSSLQWAVHKEPRTGSVITDDRLHVLLESDDEHGSKQRAIMEDVFALGDCAKIEDTTCPATAQVASQKAEWLAKRLNKGDFDKGGFTWKNMGVMAYIGNWNAIMQGGGGGSVSGRAAWVLWRGAYLTKSVSWRNKVLIPIYWFLNWAFGRDISRF
ncbi:FAD/NAD(P)-binding domain-containing protein [Lophium mytilinum]|uniref:FAD/NAD(P)-binding domain-containing protein n=1 Tax=Lophium mytilinum TaxID=390894 RepID=A0A6A6QVE2_9PEZI|nr:FAD/NAD(P)-binding domain-containing protein [Lophium mytilinum]